METSFYTDRDQLAEIDEMVKEKGYDNRSEWLREAADEKLARDGGADG